MTTSRKPSSGCFSGIARLLLCKRSLQTHPSDQITDAYPSEFDHVKTDEKDNEATKIPAGAPTNPGVVARLMGLQPLPHTIWAPEGTANPNTVSRSRSVNFMDYLLQADLADDQHLGVRSSVSFREIPSLLNQRKRDFLVVFLDDEKQKTKKVGLSLRKFEGMKQRSADKSRNKEGCIRDEVITKKEKHQRINMKMSNRQFSRFGSCRGARVSSGILSPGKRKVYRKSGQNCNSRAKTAVTPINQMEVLVESKFMRKMKNRKGGKGLQTGCSSESSSSPVTTLGLKDFSMLEGSPTKEDLRSKPISLPRKGSGGCTSGIWMSPGEVKRKEYEASENGDKEFYTGLARTLSKLTEEDVKERNWVARNVLEAEFMEDILMELGEQILGVLVRQLVQELGVCKSETFQLANKVFQHV